MSNDNVIFSATDSDNEGSKSEVKTVSSYEELFSELESRGDLP